jgi:hypothetical protein
MVACWYCIDVRDRSGPLANRIPCKRLQCQPAHHVYHHVYHHENLQPDLNQYVIEHSEYESARLQLYTPSRITRSVVSGIVEGSTVMLIASRTKDVQKIKQEKDSQRMLGIAEELARTARMSRVHTPAPKPPTGEFTFGSYKAFPVAHIPGVFPGEEKSLALLHRLAADPGIVGIMQKHRYDLRDENAIERRSSVAAVSTTACRRCCIF